MYRRRYESRRSSKPKLHKNENNKIWRTTIFNTADGILTPYNVARSWHWFRQMIAPCNVTCGSGIVTVNSPSGSTVQCDTWLWDDTPLNSPKIRHIGILNPVSISTTWLQTTCHSASVSEILSKSDHPRQKIMTSCRFSRWRISAILDFRGPIMGSLKSPCTNLATDRQTNRWTRPSHEAAIAVASGGLIMSVNSSVARRVRCELFGSNCLLFDVQLADNRKIYCVRG